LDITSENSADKIGPNDVHKFQQIVSIGMCVGLISTILFHALVKEDNSRDNLCKFNLSISISSKKIYDK
jgi:hypothetical protein